MNKRPGLFSKISTVFEERSDFKVQLEPYHPVKAAALVAGLLTEPSFHANTLRIETLVQLLVAFGEGDKNPSSGQIRSWLNAELGSSGCGNLEDPPEDVFISNVTTEAGNTRIFEGIWECNDFNLQRILNLIETLPDDQRSSKLRREINAALRISEEIASRRRLARFCSGGGMARGRVELPSFERLRSFSRTLLFSLEDLQELNISLVDLEVFILKPDLREQLKNQVWGNNELERCPIMEDEGKYFVLLPAAISVAIRRHILDWMRDQGYEKSFDQQLVAEYRDFLREVPILGSTLPRHMPLPSLQVGGKSLLQFEREVDAGRYLQVIAIVDGMAGYLNYGFSSPEQDVSELSDQIDRVIKEARSHFRKQDGFKQGLTLLIGCGYGRPMVFEPFMEELDWWVAFVSAPDLDVLSRFPGKQKLFLWKLLDQKRFLAKHGIRLFNANGLLNLCGWSEETQSFMLPPGVEFGRDPINILVPSDCLMKVRRKIRKGWDVHALPLPSGKHVRVRRIATDSFFPGEGHKSQYGCIETVKEGHFLGARLGKRLIWWLSAKSSRSRLSRDLVFRIWDAVRNWLDRAVPLFERAARDLTGPSIHIILDFNDVHGGKTGPVIEEVDRSYLSVSADREKKTIRLSLCDPFLGGFRSPKNIAEHAIVFALAKGVSMLSGEAQSEQALDTLVGRIVPNENARYVHFFEAVHFHDFIQNHDRPEKLFLDDIDEARSTLGLGWLVRDRKEGDRLGTADESVFFLNNVVDAVWKLMRVRLQRLDRGSLLEKALRYIEGVSAEKTLWQRTVLAVLSLHEDKKSAKGVAIRQIAQCNASAISLRLVVEMAISECPLEGGKPVGALDLTSLMSDVLTLFHLGGWSDAIKKEVMEPEIYIAPNGDIRSLLGFRKEIVDPLGEKFGSAQLDHEAARYEKHFEPPALVPSVKGIFPDAFLLAFEAEFELSIDDLRRFAEVLENLAVEKEKCVFVAREDEIMSCCKKSQLTNEQVAAVVLDRFSLWPRGTWDNAPHGFKRKDWYPWRFRRRLSLMTRPLVRLENSNNPRFVISPGLIRDGVKYTLSRYYEAKVEVSECGSTAMKNWVNEENNRRGHAFAQKVFEAMRAHGYEALLENKVSSLLNKKLDRNWGDVDVLAWKKGEDKVLAIECKDLMFAKTANEVAEQLNQFTGQILPNGEPDDLRKHLDRCDFLRQESQRLAQTVEMENRDIHVKSVFCFSKPVPMQYVSKRFPNVTFLTIDDLLSHSGAGNKVQ